jgi:hypothetical protein
LGHGERSPLFGSSQQRVLAFKTGLYPYSLFYTLFIALRMTLPKIMIQSLFALFLP